MLSCPAMRPLEAILLTLLAGRLIAGFSRRPAGLRNSGLAVAAALTGVAQIVLEGYRWQMLPAYVVAADLALLVVVEAANRGGGVRIPSRLGDVGRASALAVVAVSSFLSWAFPVLSLPKPVGPYPVGTQTAWLKDESRPEVYADTPGARREIMAEVWYPAKPSAAEATTAWLANPESMGPAIASWVRLPTFLFDHINLVRSNSHRDAPFADGGPYPVIVYSHGWGGFRQINQNQLEQLASSGYVVVAVDHTYGALATQFPDGRVIPVKRDILPPNGSPEFAARFAQLAGVYAQDLRFTLDALASGNQGSGPLAALRGRLDLDRIGLLGHSTGGAAVFQACGLDARCKAVIAQDPVTTGVDASITARGLAQPSLTFFSQDWQDTPNDKLTVAMLQAGRADGYRIPIAGAAHYDFVMMPFFSPLASAFKLKGPIPADQVVGLLDAYQLGFFDHYLRGAPAPLLDGATQPYKEARLERIR